MMIDSSVTKITVAHGMVREEKHELFNVNNKRYKLWPRRSRVSFYIDAKSIMSMDFNATEKGRIMDLIASIDANNYVCVYDKHKHMKVPASSLAQIYSICEFNGKSRSSSDFVNKLIKMNILAKFVGKMGSDKVTRFFLNPLIAIGNGSSTLSLTCYWMFKDIIDKHISPEEAAELTYYYNVCYFGLEPEESIDVDIISDEDQEAFDAKMSKILNVTTKEAGADKLSIFNEYVLNGKPELYSINDGRCNRIDSPEDADDTNVFYLLNQSNGNSRKSEDIVKLTNIAYDIDLGDTDTGAKYAAKKIVKERKKAFMDTMFKQLPTPTAVVDTRNGYQIIYSINDCTKEQYKQLSIAMLSLVPTADHKVTGDTSRLLRLPECHYFKTDGTNNYHYDVTLVEANPVRYDINELLAMLPQVEDVTKETKQAVSFNIPVEAPKMLTRQEAISYIKQIDFSSFLNINNPRNFACIFHDDHSPSASIIKCADGYYRYFCGSSSCDFNNMYEKGASFIDIVMYQLDCGMQTALDYLCGQMNITITKAA